MKMFNQVTALLPILWEHNENISHEHWPHTKTEGKSKRSPLGSYDWIETGLFLVQLRCVSWGCPSKSFYSSSWIIFAQLNMNFLLFGISLWFQTLGGITYTVHKFCRCHHRDVPNAVDVWGPPQTSQLSLRAVGVCTLSHCGISSHMVLCLLSGRERASWPLLFLSPGQPSP